MAFREPMEVKTVEPASLQPRLLQAAFALETVAHLWGMERELLPLAEHLRQTHRLLTQIRIEPADIYYASAAERIKECLR